MTLRVIVAEDEPLARERLRTLLQSDPEIELVGECADGREAVAAILNRKPDLVLLDVQMPELNGFAVLREISDQFLPAVIFVTAHDEFAVKAFEMHALDYLLKPFSRERFEKALERAKAQIGRKDNRELTQRLRDLLEEVNRPPKTMDRIVIKSSGRMTFLKFPEIDWIEADDNYLQVHVGAQTHLLRETMSSLEKRLPPALFLRISRSVIVNVDRIKELQPLFHGDYAVILRDGTRLTLSRSHRGSLAQLLGK